MKTIISVVFLVVSLFLVATPFSFAQTPQNDWGMVQKLVAGTNLFIKTLKGKTIKGSLVSVNDSELEVEVKGNRRSLLKDDVKAIYYSVPKSGKREKIIGSIVGLFVGGAVSGVVNKDAVLESDYNYSALVLLSAGGFAGGRFIGGKIGKGRKKGALIYKVK